MKKLTSMLMVATVALLLLAPRGGLCGPVIISGLDTEYGIRPGNSTHGTIAMWASVINTGILTHVTSCGSLVNPSGNILVIGGGKGAVGTDEMTDFWTKIGTTLSRGVTFVNGASNISSQSFAGFSMIAICNTTAGVGTLTSAELTAISGRQTDVANFVNCGGGLFASSCNLNPQYGYINIGSPSLIAINGGGPNSTPTAAGTAMGIGPIAGPFHVTFTQWPSFLSVLSNLTPRTPKACILGGVDVKIPVTPSSDPCCPPWNATAMSDMLIPVFSGGANAPYTLHFVPTPALNSQMQAYINYLHSMNSSINQITIDWRLHDQGTGTPCTNCVPPYGPQIGSTVWTTWTQGGSGSANFTNPGFFTGFPMVKGHCYMIHTGIYLEGGQHFFPDSCSVTEVCVQWQVSLKSSEPPILAIRSGKTIIKSIPIQEEKFRGDPNEVVKP